MKELFFIIYVVLSWFCMGKFINFLSKVKWQFAAFVYMVVGILFWVIIGTLITPYGFSFSKGFIKF